jgi:hypothetical protein
LVFGELGKELIGESEASTYLHGRNINSEFSITIFITEESTELRGVLVGKISSFVVTHTFKKGNDLVRARGASRLRRRREQSQEQKQKSRT